MSKSQANALLNQLSVDWDEQYDTIAELLSQQMVIYIICELCTSAAVELDAATMTAHEQTFIRLQKELIRGLDALFVFVTHPQVEATNNRSERNVRHEAMVRKGGRTSKSPSGAKRRGIIMTVLATLNTRFESFTLNNLLDEMSRWAQAGLSRFQQELAALELSHPPPVT